MKIKRKELQQIIYWYEQKKKTKDKQERKEIDKKINQLGIKEG